jgi:hypothetical protein
MQARVGKARIVRTDGYLMSELNTPTKEQIRRIKGIYRFLLRPVKPWEGQEQQVANSAYTSRHLRRHFDTRVFSLSHNLARLGTNFSEIRFSDPGTF